MAVALRMRYTKYNENLMTNLLYLVVVLLIATAPSHSSGAARQTPLPRAVHLLERFLIDDMKFSSSALILPQNYLSSP